MAIDPIANPTIEESSVFTAFQNFGYTPTADEIGALTVADTGNADILTSAVGQYINYKQTQDAFAASDPLTALQKQMNDQITLNQNQVQGLYGQLQSTLSAAPELFGSLTPDQITTYLAPLQTAFQAQLSSVQGAMAARGVAGSSTENNALAQTGQQFEQNVLSTGLSVGEASQTAKANAIQAQINNLFGLTSTETQISGTAAGQQSAQNLGQSQLIASLPSFLGSQAQQEQAIYNAQNPKGGFQSDFNQVTGDITQGFNAAVPVFNTATAAAQKLTGQTTPGVSAPAPSGGLSLFQSPASQAPGGVNYAAPNASLDVYGSVANPATGLPAFS